MCGEYLSAEVELLLKELGIDINNATEMHFDNLLFSTSRGKTIEAKLPLGGYGISRYQLDFDLYQIYIQKADFELDKVLDVNNESDYFEVKTKTKSYTCKQFIMATGKRSILDKSLSRDFVQNKSPWLAIKRHYKFDMPTNQVQLHNFNGGYAGLSKVENGDVNLCYLATFDSFKEYKDIDRFNENVVARNPFLEEFFAKAEPQWEQPISISQISFEEKKPVENDIIMIGDTAGLIHPLCGNGMAMAIDSAVIAARCIDPFLHNSASKQTCLKNYDSEWKKTFKSRLRMGRYLQNIFLNQRLTKFSLGLLKTVPAALPLIIRKTHGSKISV